MSGSATSPLRACCSWERAENHRRCLPSEHSHGAVLRIAPHCTMLCGTRLPGHPEPDRRRTLRRIAAVVPLPGIRPAGRRHGRAGAGSHLSRQAGRRRRLASGDHGSDWSQLTTSSNCRFVPGGHPGQDRTQGNRRAAMVAKVIDLADGDVQGNLFSSPLAFALATRAVARMPPGLPGMARRLPPGLAMAQPTLCPTPRSSATSRWSMPQWRANMTIRR